jgi:hypothetical protein
MSKKDRLTWTHLAVSEARTPDENPISRTSYTGSQVRKYLILLYFIDFFFRFVPEGGSSNEREAQLHVKDLIARFSEQIASFTGDMQKHETIKIEGVVYRTIVPRRISKVTASGDHKRRKLPIPESSIRKLVAI